MWCVVNKDRGLLALRDSKRACLDFLGMDNSQRVVPGIYFVLIISSGEYTEYYIFNDKDRAEQLGFRCDVNEETDYLETEVDFSYDLNREEPYVELQYV